MKKNKGFTLIELVVVMAIIAILATLVIGAILVARQTASRTANTTNAKTLQTAVEADYTKHPGAYTVISSTSFTTAAAGLGVTLGNSPCTGTNAGGGTFASGTNGYTITPSDVAAAGSCTGTLTPIVGP